MGQPFQKPRPRKPGETVEEYHMYLVTQYRPKLVAAAEWSRFQFRVVLVVFVVCVTAVAVATAFMLGGCERTERGPILVEPGRVAQTIYVPRHTVPDTEVYVDVEGHLSIRDTTTTVWPQHVVVFECQHGRFAIDGEQVWRKLHDGDKVEIRYREVFRVDGSGEKERRVFKAFEFVDADPVGRSDAPGEAGGVPAGAGETDDKGRFK